MPLCQFSLFRWMKDVDSEEFFNYTRMNVDLFHELSRHLWRRLYKPHGQAINPETKHTLTLKYLAQGGSIQSMAWDYNIGKCTARKIILEVCTAIWEELKPTYMASLSYPEWLQIENKFWEKWQFPLCLGATDGKHIRIKAPPISRSKFFKIKKFFSIVLMAACDADYRFTFVDVEAYGSDSNATILSLSAFGSSLLITLKS
ncbi:uncharacterized protein LOC111613873 [Centruroides sculpturatus]|uniref:uncharacterized protein LOC111613873 n=1 Tax=Centruroides sculpturatus TaxID=218467 RepID=UPI000C6EA2BB|nr:uncharacterized protein LOC111613873 [Centruroides sculpturatus]